MQRGRPAGTSPQLGLPLLGLFYPLISQVLFSSEFNPISLRRLRGAQQYHQVGDYFLCSRRQERACERHTATLRKDEAIHRLKSKECEER